MPPVGQPVAVVCAGLQSQNVTVPEGVPAVPVNVAVSLTAAPGRTPAPEGVDDVVIEGSRFEVVKHSLVAFV